MVDEKDKEARDALDTAIRASGEENRFWAVRAITIQHYALFEQSLGDLFMWLSGTNPNVAGIIFFRLGAAVRRPILEKLFKYKLKNEYSSFRNSLIKSLQGLEADRNEIVHWNVVNRIESSVDGVVSANLAIEPPSLWPEASPTKRWGINEMNAYQEKMMFYNLVIRQFTIIVLQRATAIGVPDDWHQSWREIFLQPIIYPPPELHPAVRFRHKPEIPPQS